jgi:hypothetical protein
MLNSKTIYSIELHEVIGAFEAELIEALNDN